MKLYHNPRCQKSREALQLLESKKLDFEVIEYMKDPISPADLEDLLAILEMPAIELVRTKEADWKDNFKDKEIEDEEIVLAMIEFPKLMERPIFVNNNKAVVARPADRILEII